jgi:hypothetical protein
MHLKKQLLFKYVPLSSLVLYKDIPRNILSVIEAVTNKLSSENGLTIDGVELFLQTHPIHVIKKASRYECIAGLRAYQLAKNCLDEKCLIPILIHKQTENEDIESLAITDALLSSLVFGLDQSAWSKDIVNLYDAVDIKIHKEILLTLGNKNKLATLIERSRQSIYTKELPPKSSLKRKQSGKTQANLKKQINKKSA